MAFIQPQYAEVADFKEYAGSGDIEDDTINALLQAASDQIDSLTGSWFDSRTAVNFQVTVPRDSRNVWIPVPLISNLVVVEETTTLTEITSPGGTGEFYAYRMRRSLRLEKSTAHLWEGERRSVGAHWSGLPKGVIVTGTFGYNPTPPRIVTLCSAMAASIGDYRKHVFENEEGDISSTPISSYPAWIRKELRTLKVNRNIKQILQVTF